MIYECPVCEGHGVLWYGSTENYHICDLCLGSGEIEEEDE